MRRINFLLDEPLAKKLKREPSYNRRFNNQSEILRTLVDLYFTDHRVKRLIHDAMASKMKELFGPDED